MTKPSPGTNGSAGAGRPSSQDIPQLMDDLFRHKAGELISTLTRIFGVEQIDLAEDVVQEALLKALQLWPYHGIPRNPGGWLLRTARNRALDILRRETSFRDKRDLIKEQLTHLEPAADQALADHDIRDDQLRMIFACCHPGVPQPAQVALTLKTLCGLSIPEIASAFLAPEQTVSQRIVRAKRRLREGDVAFEIPAGAELPRRLGPVLDVLYLMFNEGYSAHRGDSLLRVDLCTEAIRLTEMVLEHPLCDRPDVHALLSLLLLQASRLPARVDSEGNVLLLEEQDRSKWARDLLNRGLVHLGMSAQGDELTTFHLQAGIAACHAAAPDYASTDWPAILDYYDLLVQRSPSPVIHLNRAVALSKVKGPQPALKALASLEDDKAMAGYYLFPATRADLHHQLGESAAAARYWKLALDLAQNTAEKRLLQRKLAGVQEPLSPSRQQ